MKYYLLDFENVNSSGLDGISELSEDSRIVLFYTRNSNKIDLGLFNQVRDMKAQLSVIEVHHGKQALDIQLASYLGYLIGTEPEDTEYYIISKDKGYMNVQSFWPDRKITLCRNLYDDSEIVNEPPEPKRTSSSSSSRGRRRTSAAKATKTAQPAPAETKEPAPVEEKPAPEKLAKEQPAEEPKPNAFAEAAAIAKAVVEAKKARDKASEQAAADEPKKPVRKTAAKKTSTRKTAAKKADTKKADTKKAAPEKAEPEKTEPAKAETKKAPARKSSPKKRISDIRAEVNNEIQRILSKEGVDGDIVNSTASFVSKNVGKEGYKQTVYRGIIRQHGQKQGLAIYRLIKDIL